MKYKCPICNYKAANLSALKRHFRNRHVINTICPVCGEKVANLAHHASLFNDEKHLIIYYLSRRASISHNNHILREKYKKALRITLDYYNNSH